MAKHLKDLGATMRDAARKITSGQIERDEELAAKRKRALAASRHKLP